jgi:hypothetical protein
MRTFLIAGLFYLTGIATILILKPSLMFTEEGVWKEFGIGRNPATHTWMPLWLFAILWAIVSYILSLLFCFLVFGPKGGTSQTNVKGNKVQQIMDLEEVIEMPSEDTIVKKSVKKGKLPSGYYLLNSQGKEGAGGIPNYIYLGKELPTNDD